MIRLRYVEIFITFFSSALLREGVMRRRRQAKTMSLIRSQQKNSMLKWIILLSGTA